MQKSRTKKIVIGVTGGFGTGKSTVAQIFKSLGAKVIDADKIARNLLKSGASIYKKITFGDNHKRFSVVGKMFYTFPYHKKILRAFGKDILKKNGTIDRSKLATVVFGNKKLLLRLNKIIHPEVIKIIKQKIKSLNQGVIVLDIPLLFEAGLECLADKIVVISSNRQNQYRRLLKKTYLSKKEIAKRINAQMPLSKKIRRADYIIDNNYSIKNTEKQAKELMHCVMDFRQCTRGCGGDCSPRLGGAQRTK